MPFAHSANEAPHTPKAMTAQPVVNGSSASCAQIRATSSVAPQKHSAVSSCDAKMLA